MAIIAHEAWLVLNAPQLVMLCRKQIQLCICVAALIFMSATGARADVLAQYFLDGTVASSDSNTFSVASNITVSGISLGYATVGGQQGSMVTAMGVDNGDYYSFSLTANSGFELNLNGGSLTLQDRTSRANTFSYSVFSSVDSYTTALASFSLSTADTWTSRTINLNGAFDDLSSISFRLVLSDNSPANSRELYFDNIFVNGSASEILPIPEPTVFSFALLGGLTLFFARSRNKSRSQS